MIIEKIAMAAFNNADNAEMLKKGAIIDFPGPKRGKTLAELEDFAAYAQGLRQKRLAQKAKPKTLYSKILKKILGVVK